MSTELDPLEDDLAVEYVRRRRLSLGRERRPARTTARDGLPDRTPAVALELDLDLERPA